MCRQKCLSDPTNFMVLIFYFFVVAEFVFVIQHWVTRKRERKKKYDEKE